MITVFKNKHTHVVATGHDWQVTHRRVTTCHTTVEELLDHLTECRVDPTWLRAYHYVPTGGASYGEARSAHAQVKTKLTDAQAHALAKTMMVTGKKASAVLRDALEAWCGHE